MLILQVLFKWTGSVHSLYTYSKQGHQGYDAYLKFTAITACKDLMMLTTSDIDGLAVTKYKRNR
tara:strand:- start:232 stop:423 length:192 start_codon:yes stop_codon:yes gene_type:complete